MGLAGPALAMDEPFHGVWSTALVVDEVMTRFLVDIGPNGAILTVIDTGGLRLPAATMALTPPSLSLTWSEGLTIQGRLATTDRIEGTFTQDGVTQPLVLTRGARYQIDNTVLSVGPMDRARLRRLRTLSGAPAMGVAFEHPGREPVIMVDGRRSADAAAPVAETDAWHIGSDTKSMTATLVARLVEAGRLNWTTTISDVLGDTMPDMHPDYGDVTLLHLLSHRAGLPREIEQKDMRDFKVPPPPDPRAVRRAYVQLGLKRPPIGPKGTTLSYSNLGYVAVGAMLETLEGAPWETLMRQRLFSPLGLRSAGFGPPGDPIALDQPFGHLRRADGRLHSVADPRKNDLPFVYGPAGLVHISLGDMLTYLKAHRNQSANFLRPESWRTLHAPPFGGQSMGLGWGVGPNGELGHAGSNGQWWHQVHIEPKSGLVFCAALNAATPEAQSVVDQALKAARRSV
ncbi:serine hydrolase [Caulobacter vibrioides]|nr:serine hydrolase [Caulobacter vibrioides]PLR15119.1 serine hydrolase [Caulobacter vibrioides]